MVKGKLNKIEVMAIKRVTQDREMKPAFGNDPEVRDHRQLIGALGELAFAKAIGVYPRSSFLPNSEAKKEHYDFKVNNKTIEIKTVDSCTNATRLMVADTRAAFDNLKHADFYVLMGVGLNFTGETADYEIRGWIEGAELFKDIYYSKSEQFRYKIKLTFPARVVQKDELNEFQGSNLQEITTIQIGCTL